MSMLQSTTVAEPIRDERAFPVPPGGSARWRRWKAKKLCQAAAALRRLGTAHNRIGETGTTTGILTYHHVAKSVASDPYLLNVTPEQFHKQLKGLLDIGYHPCSLRDVVGCHQNQRPLPAKSFVVVFDDGHHSVHENAWPILRELKIPATIFLATGYLDRDAPLPFDACQTALARCGDRRRPLTTTECAEMLEDGLIDLGSHTHAHEDFCGRPDQFTDDLHCSLQLLRDRFGLEKVTFSFPYGRFDAAMQRILQDNQLLCGLTAECHPVSLDAPWAASDPFAWGRFGASQFDTAGTLAAKLDGWYTWLQAHWRRLRG